MSIFASAALAAFLLCGSLWHPRQLRWLRRIANRRIARRAYELYLFRGSVPGRDIDDWLQAEREFWLSVGTWTGLGFGLVVLTVLILVVMILSFEWLGYRAFLVARGLTGTEATQAILGMAFGSGLRYWLAERSKPEIAAIPQYGSPGEGQSPGAKTPVKADRWLGIVLLIVLLAGGVIPYASPWFARMTSLKTPYGEVQFSLPKTEENIIFQVTRDHYKMETLDFIEKRLPTLLTNDLDYLALVPNTQKADSARSMQQWLDTIIKPLIQCTNQALLNNNNLTSIRSELRPAVQVLRRWIQADEQKEHTTFVVAVGKSWQAMQKLIAELSPGRELTDCPWSGPWFEDAQQYGLPGFAPQIPLLMRGPYIYILLARLLWFLEDIEGSINLLREKEQEFRDDMNFNLTLAILLYTQGDDLKEARQYLQMGLKIADDAASRVDFELKRTDAAVSKDKLHAMEKRFRAAKRLFKNTIAYWSAKAGDSPFTARLYAKENYDLYPDDPEIIDTYGYVRMAFAARKIPPDFDEILEAKRLFEEAISSIKTIKTPTAVDKKAKQRTQLILEQHLEQAKELLLR